MRAIYEPRGAAREYAPLAVNLYSGCSHGCVYCYAPACLRRTRADFARVGARKGVLEQLARDAKALAGDPRPVLLSFTSDPYQEAERDFRLTRAAIGILADGGLGVRLLTKNPACALELDADLLKRAEVDFGTTILFLDDSKRGTWEPNAPSIESRMTALAAAHEAGLPTWVSLEPVIDPRQALALIDTIHSSVDVWKVGKWNHDARARSIDCASFTFEAVRLLERLGARYYIKDELWRAAGPEVRASCSKQRL